MNTTILCKAALCPEVELTEVPMIQTFREKIKYMLLGYTVSSHIRIIRIVTAQMASKPTYLSVTKFALSSRSVALLRNMLTEISCTAASLNLLPQ